MEARVEYLALRCGLSAPTKEVLLAVMGVDPITRCEHPNGAIHLPRREVEKLAAEFLAENMSLPFSELLSIVKEGFIEVDAAFPWGDRLELLPGARELLLKIKGAGGRVGVVTHDSTGPAARHLRHAGLAGLVDVVVGLDVFHIPKPAPEGIFKACELLGVPPGKTVVVGDSPGDVLAGKRAGCRLTIGVLTGRGTGEDLSVADCVVRMLKEVEVT